jgi:peroxin-5
LAQAKHSTWQAEFGRQSDKLLAADELRRFSEIFEQLNHADLAAEFAKREAQAIPAESVDAESFAFEEAWQRQSEAEGPEEAEDAEETARSARILLESLDLSDAKLKASRFVAYLKELCESDSCINGTLETKTSSAAAELDWSDQFKAAISAAGLDQDPDDEAWKGLEKDWDKHAFSGLGYEGFAASQFANYQYSAESGAFAQMSAAMLVSSLAGASLSERILALEELTRRETREPAWWLQLAQAQSENELDVQAIAAYYRCLEFNPQCKDALLGLGTACVNEYCIPDALDAFEKLASLFGITISPSLDAGSSRLDQLLACFQNSSLFGDQKTRGLAYVVLLNVKNEPEKALDILESLAKAHPADHGILNRLGATYANARQYDAALACYSRALELHPSYVRAVYNTAISHMNRSEFAQATEALVTALGLHLPVGAMIGDGSESLETGHAAIWRTLRIVADMWGRGDLSVMAEERDLTGIRNRVRGS